MDFARISQFFTLDVISDVAFGAPFGDLTTHSDQHEYIAAMEQSLPALMVILNVPFLGSFLKLHWVATLLAPTTKDKKGLGKIMG